MTSSAVGSLGSPLLPPTAPHVRLVVQGGGDVSKTIECRHLVTLLGARAGCKVQLNHETVSPVHAVVICDGETVHGVDLVSQNGTRLNNLKMELETIHDGDMLEIFPFEFRVDIENPSQHAIHADGLVTLEPSPEAVALELVGTGRLLRPARAVCLIGRREGCDIVLQDKKASRAHCLLMHFQGHPAIVDLLSAHGTLVNGQPVSFHMLQNGDIVRIGETDLKVHVVESAVVRAAKNGNGHTKTNGAASAVMAKAMVENPSGPDMIDIALVEGAERWSIADSARKLAKKN